jgi:hypothetical protein
MVQCIECDKDLRKWPTDDHFRMTKIDCDPHAVSNNCMTRVAFMLLYATVLQYVHMFFLLASSFGICYSITSANSSKSMIKSHFYTLYYHLHLFLLDINQSCFLQILQVQSTTSKPYHWPNFSWSSPLFINYTNIYLIFTLILPFLTITGPADHSL